KMLTKVRACARRAGYYTRSENAFGVPVEYYNGIPLMDAGKYFDGTKSTDIIATSAASSSAAGTTDIYAIRIGIDGLHGVSPTGNKVVETHYPDLNAPGAVKKGDVELVAGLALKNSRAAGVLKGIKIVPKTA
ncbi:MAG: phage capsid protein, partial [Oscillospiraceae bacterium]|nr:phage capsid protein [Oscillospiraceae bacterium]